jgi:hypothetical protein
MDGEQKLFNAILASKSYRWDSLLPVTASGDWANNKHSGAILSLIILMESIGLNREQRLNVFSRMTGRRIDSAKELKVCELYALLTWVKPEYDVDETTKSYILEVKNERIY